jgi:hypothetical protein
VFVFSAYRRNAETLVFEPYAPQTFCCFTLELPNPFLVLNCYTLVAIYQFKFLDILVSFINVFLMFGNKRKAKNNRIHPVFMAL